MFMRDSLYDGEQRRKVVNVHGVSVDRFGEDSGLLAELSSALLQTRRLFTFWELSEKTFRSSGWARSIFLSARQPCSAHGWRGTHKSAW